MNWKRQRIRPINGLNEPIHIRKHSRKVTGMARKRIDNLKN